MVDFRAEAGQDDSVGVNFGDETRVPDDVAALKLGAVLDRGILVDGALVNEPSLATDGFGWWLRTLSLLNLADREFRSLVFSD